jgi:membrane dipeptidase
VLDQNNSNPTKLKTNLKTKILIHSILLVQQLFAQSYQKLHDKAILIDTHNDFLSKIIEYGFVFNTDLTGKTHSDLARLKKGGFDVQIFSVFCDGTKKNPYICETN